MTGKLLRFPDPEFRSLLNAERLAPGPADAVRDRILARLEQTLALPPEPVSSGATDLANRGRETSPGQDPSPALGGGAPAAPVGGIAAGGAATSTGVPFLVLLALSATLGSLLTFGIIDPPELAAPAAQEGLASRELHSTHPQPLGELATLAPQEGHESGGTPPPLVELAASAPQEGSPSGGPATRGEPPTAARRSASLAPPSAAAVPPVPIRVRSSPRAVSPSPARPASSHTILLPVREQAAPTTEVLQDWYLAEERAIVGQARELLAQGDGPAALNSLNHHQRRYPAGRLAEEREALRVLALLRLDRRTEAQRAATHFFQRFPQSILRSTVEQAILERDAR